MHAASWGRFLGLFFSLKNKGTNVHSRRAVYYDWKAVTKNDGFLSQPRPLVLFCFFPAYLSTQLKFFLPIFAAQVMSCTGYWKFVSKKPLLCALTLRSFLFVQTFRHCFHSNHSWHRFSLLDPVLLFHKRFVCMTLYPLRRKHLAREVRKRRSRWGRCSVISVVERAWAACVTWPGDGPVHSGLYITLQHLFV